MKLPIEAPSLGTNSDTSVSMGVRWDDLAQRVLDGGTLTNDEGLAVLRCPDDELLDLLSATFRVRRHWWGKQVRLNFLINAKSGACVEDCGYCSQSRFSESEIQRYGMLKPEKILDGARMAFERKAKTFCIVTSGRKPTPREIEFMGQVVPKIKDEYKLEVCYSAGLLGNEEAERLMAVGVDRVNHNLNTSRRYYPEICNHTLTYQDRVDTIQAARKAGMEVCSGGIVGMGEEEQDVVDLALTLGELGVEALPVNFFNPIALASPLALPKAGAWRRETHSAVLPENDGTFPTDQSSLRSARGGRSRGASAQHAADGTLCGQLDVRGRLPHHAGPSAAGRLPHDRGSWF